MLTPVCLIECSRGIDEFETLKRERAVFAYFSDNDSLPAHTLGERPFHFTLCLFFTCIIIMSLCVLS